MKTLVTGSGSGIGKYLLREFSAEEFTRLTPFETIKNNAYDLIIHCATNHCRYVDSKSLLNVYEDNIFLTNSLLSIINPRTIFIYFSSIEVYPNLSNHIFTEEEIFPVDNTLSLYGITKLMSEVIVRRMCTSHIIIRPGLLLGEFMRPNSVTKITATNNKKEKITLTKDSEFYMVSYEEVMNFILEVIRVASWGTYNLMHSDVITLGEVAEIFGTQPEWGSFRYHRPSISNEKSACILQSLTSPPRENLKNWLKIINDEK